MLRVILAFLLVLVLAACGFLGFVAYNLERLVNDYREDLGTQASKYLGRPVKFGPVRITYRDSAGVEFTRVTLAGPKETQATHTAVVDRLFLRLDVVKMARTRLRRLEVQEAVLEGARFSLRRKQDGTWDFADIVQHFAREARQEAELTTKTPNEYFKELEIAGLQVVDGEVVVEDEELKQRYTVRKVNVRVSTIVPGRDVRGEVKLQLFDGQTPSSLEAEVAILPLPADLEFKTWPTARARVVLDRSDLGTWGKLLPTGVVQPAQGWLGFNLDARIRPDDGLATLTGTAAVDQLRLVQNGQLGEESNLGLDVHVDAGLREPTITVHRLDARGPGLQLTTRLRMVDRTPDGVRDAKVDLQVQELKRLLAIVPEGSGLLPKQLALEGPFTVSVQGDARGGHLVVDLDQAHVAWEGVLDKGTGTPLHLDLTVVRRPEEIVLKPISLQLADANVAAEFHLPPNGQGPVRGHVTTGDLRVSKLRGLFPAAGGLNRKGVKVDGVVRLTAAATVVNGMQAFQGDMALQQVDVRVPRVRVTGDSAVTVQDTPDREGRHRVEVSGDFLALAIEVADEKGKPLLRKRRGAPADLYVDLSHQGAETKVTRAQLNLGNSTLAVGGVVTGLGSERVDLDLRTQQLLVDASDVRGLLPALARLPAGTAEAVVAVKGSPQAAADLNLLVDSLEVTLGRSHLAGVVAVKGTTDPVLGIRLDSVGVDFAELSRALPSVGLPPRGNLQARLSVTGRPMDTRTLRVGVEDLEGRVFDINLRGRGKVANLQAPEFDVWLDADRVDVDALLAHFSDGTPKEAAPGAKPQNPRGLPAETRKEIAKLNGVAEVHLGQLKYDQYVLRNVDARLRLARSTVQVEQLAWSLYGGRFDAAGTEARLGEEWLKDRLVVSVRGLDIARVVSAHSDKGGRVGGMVDADIDVVTRGMTGQDIMDSVQGPVSISSPEVRVAGLNILGQMFQRLNDMVPVRIPLGGPLLDPDRQTAFRDVLVEGRFGGRRFVSSRPMQTESEFGVLSMAGSIFMDSRIDLVGSATLQPAVISEVTRGAFRPPDAVMVPVQLGGTWSDPKVKGVDLRAFADGLGIAGLAGKALEAADEARKEMEARAQAAKQVADEVRQAAMRDAQERASAAAADAEERTKAAVHAAELAARDPSEATRRAAADARARAEDAQRRAQEARRTAEGILEGSPLGESRRMAEEAARAGVADAQARAESMVGAAQDVGADALSTVEDVRKQAGKDAAAAGENAKKTAEDARKRAKSLLDRVFQ
jgi:hypothetical protein